MKKLLLLLVILSLVFYTSGQETIKTWTFRKQNGHILGKHPKTGKEIVFLKDEDRVGLSDGDSVSIEQTYTIVSFAGSYLSTLHYSNEFIIGSAHPNVIRTFEVINAETGKPIKLTEFYSETEILNALLQDKIIIESISAGSQPKNFQELVDMTEDPCDMELGWNMLDSFAFHHIEGEKVAVRIGLSNVCSAANGMFTQLGLLMPIPQKLKTLLQEAASRKTLMKDLLPKISKSL